MKFTCVNICELPKICMRSAHARTEKMTAHIDSKWPRSIDLDRISEISYRRRPSWNFAESPKFGNSGLHISALRAPTAKKLIYSESVDQWHSNAPQLVHLGQVLGKLNFSPVGPSPAANTRRKKKNLTYSESVDPARQYQMALVKIDH